MSRHKWQYAEGRSFCECGVWRRSGVDPETGQPRPIPGEYIHPDGRKTKQAGPCKIDALRERLCRANALLERVRQWFEQNEGRLKQAGIGGFKLENEPHRDRG